MPALGNGEAELDQEAGCGSTPGSDADRIMAEAELVLDNLLSTVKAEREELLRSAAEERDRMLMEARAIAAAEGAHIREEAWADKERIISEAAQEAGAIVREARLLVGRQKEAVIEVVQESLDRLSQVEELRKGLEDTARKLNEDVETIENPEVPAPREVDPAALQTLVEQLGDDECREVIDTFLIEIAKQIEQLEGALDPTKEKSQEISRVLHNLSSGCATVGAYDAAELCASMTAESPREHFEDLLARARRVRDEVSELRN